VAAKVFMKHGRAVIPFGKYKGVRIRLLPDGYLSWLTTAPMMRTRQWQWLWDSVVAELKFRGFEIQGCWLEDPVEPEPAPVPVPARRMSLA